MAWIDKSPPTTNWGSKSGPSIGWSPKDAPVSTWNLVELGFGHGPFGHIAFGHYSSLYGILDLWSGKSPPTTDWT